MKKTLKTIAILVVIFLSVIVLIKVGDVLFNPLRQDEGQIRKNILEITPIGMMMEDVRGVIDDKRDWEIRYVGDENTSVDTGMKKIEAYIGSYHNLFETSVTVYWRFDKNSRLIDVFVHKFTDSL